MRRKTLRLSLCGCGWMKGCSHVQGSAIRMVKGLLKKPAAKKPASIIMFPIMPKRGNGLRAMRRPGCESRDKAYTTHGRTKLQRNRQATVGVDVGVKVKADRTVVNELVALGLVP
eukprot:12522-Amphidinium_carterae.1